MMVQRYFSDFLIMSPQRDYVKRDGVKKNRLVKTSYFYGTYKPFELGSQRLTAREEKDGFKLQLVPFCELEKFVLENRNNNPRNIYFQREMIEITRLYMNLFGQKGTVKKSN